MQSSASRAQEAAQEFNLNTRFGRNELVMERVAAKVREEFGQHHRGWGSSIRIADSELGGLHMASDSDAEVSVRVAWYRPDEEDLHVTQLRQKWHDQKGVFVLVAEERIDGDVGLLGERIVQQAPDTPPRASARLPTIRIGAPDPVD
jgi:hypothetical protein